MDILYGRNPVREALRAGRPARKLVVAEGLAEEPRLREILALAGAQGIPVEMAGRAAGSTTSPTASTTRGWPATSTAGPRCTSIGCSRAAARPPCCSCSTASRIPRTSGP